MNTLTARARKCCTLNFSPARVAKAVTAAIKSSRLCSFSPKLRDTIICCRGGGTNSTGRHETHAKDIQIRAELQAMGHGVLVISVHDLHDKAALFKHFISLARKLIRRDVADRVRGEADNWFAPLAPSAPATVETNPSLPFAWCVGAVDEQYKTCVPIFSLKTAAGAVSEGQAPELLGWAQPETRKHLNETIFIAQVCEKSMEPKDPDGSWCLFSTHVVGDRFNRILVIQHRDIADPETSGNYTLKKNGRPPQNIPDGAERTDDIPLRPLNPAFEPIVINHDLQETRVVAELIAVLG